MTSMRTARALGLAFAALWVSAIAPAAPVAALSTVQDQSDLDLSGAFVMSGFLAADDLNFPVNSRIDTVTVWLTDSLTNDNGILDGFSGVLSWAIYSDNPGPGFEFNHGTDTTPELVDTGLQTDDGRDVFRARIELDGRPIVGPGRVWLIVHEGAWGSAGDGSSIYWLESTSTRGSAAYVTGNEVNPTPAEWLLSLHDAALVVEADPHDWFEGFLETVGAGNISQFVSASDFFLPAPRTIGSLDAWIADLGPENGRLDGFSDTLSWAIYSDAAGDPGTLLASGQDATPRLLDSGLDLDLGGDIVRIRIELQPRPVLPAGTFWLVLHEGDWGSVYDGSSVYWVMYPGVLGSSSRVAGDETDPGPWGVLFGSNDLAFVLFNDEIFSSGFDAGATCAWSDTAGGATCP